MSFNRPRVTEPTTFGDPKAGKFWVEYPSGLIDITSNHPLPANAEDGCNPFVAPEPALCSQELEFDVQGDRRLRLAVRKAVAVIVDMQNFFLHPELRAHPLGLNCVQPLVELVPYLREKGVHIVWCNWGLTVAELLTIPPSLARSFTKPHGGGFGSTLPGDFGRLLMRGERNSELYGPLQGLFSQGKERGTDVQVHKNRMSGIWGGQSELDLYLQSQGYDTILFGGVNADQCVLGTLVDAYYKGYNCILLEDCTATSSPEGAKANFVYNCARSYGFVVDHNTIKQNSTSGKEDPGKATRDRVV